jgi:UDP-2,3-diacylglucosamine hydrolase
VAPETLPKLGVLAGQGPLPAQVVQAARDAGREVFVLAFEGETDPALVDGEEHAWVSLGRVGRAVGHLHAAGVREVCMIGPVRRPSLSTLKLDWRAVRMMARLGAATGDDRLRKIIVEELESEGFRVVGADEVSGGLLAPEGPLTEVLPDDGARADIALGARVARALGQLDVGQAVVVQQGLVLGVEAVEGTDRLIERCGALRREGRGGVLVKLKKPAQERRADLPTIGPETATRAAAAGLAGIAVEAGQTLFVGRERLVERANAAGLFVVGIRADG